MKNEILRTQTSSVTILSDRCYV